MKNLWVWIVIAFVAFIVIFSIIGSIIEHLRSKPVDEDATGPYAFLVIDAGRGSRYAKLSPGFPGKPFPNADELTPAPSVPEPTLVTRELLGTVGNIRIWGPDPDVNTDKANMAFDRIEDVGEDLSLYNPKSLLWDINNNAGGDPVRITDPMMTVLKRALLIADFTDGAFDPTIGPSVLIWRDAMMTLRLPPPDQVDAARALVDYKLLKLDEAAHTARLAKPGMILDLSAIAKGYLADVGAQFLADKSVAAATVELGGDIAAFGTKPDGSPFRIYIENPFFRDGDAVGFVEGKGNFCVVTSGNYRQSFTINSERFSHFIDPKTGRAIAGASSCTVTGPDAMTCDALATAICVIGPERGFLLMRQINAWYKKHPPEKQ